MAPIYRTPDHAFMGLTDFPYQPHYMQWDGLRTHYVDEGPKDAPVALLIHGEPTWSYLYRKMIPPLLSAGYRCIAPDHIGFGRSDKVTDDNWYVIDRHIERLAGAVRQTSTPIRFAKEAVYYPARKPSHSIRVALRLCLKWARCM